MDGPLPADADRQLSYEAAGVDLEAADRAVARIAEVAARAQSGRVIGGIGGFGGLVAFDHTRYRDPVLVSSADGVGTKIEIARQLDRLDTIGIDLVAMVVDDVVVPGGDPLFVNDYLAVGKVDPDRVGRIVAGVAEGCRIAGCDLAGGETAEHPGVMADDAFDLAGFAVGVVDRDDILGPHRVQPGDAVVGLASSGLHSNGFSLVRAIVAGADLGAAHGLGRPLGEELLAPTRIYAQDVLALIRAVPVHALCHVTGGGIPGNLPRVLPEGLGAVVDAGAWPRPAIFSVLQAMGPVAEEEMWRTFNVGLGMLALVAPRDVAATLATLTERGVDAWVVGQVTEEVGVRISGDPGTPADEAASA